MRILLTATASYTPPRGGATRSNLVWLDRLARAGHECRVVCGPPGEGAELRHHPSICLLPVAQPARRIEALRREIGTFQPDWVLVSSEDLGHGLLREADHSAAGRVVYLAHTPQFFPFGPASWNPDAAATRRAADSAGIVAIGRHMAEYIERCLGRRVAVIHPPIYGAGPFRQLGNFERGLVTMINPCAVKGISLFLQIAERMPDLAFGAVPGWGTTGDDRRAIGRLRNVRWLPNAAEIDDVLAETRVLLMPSLWYEGFGLIVIEGMLRGIPVVASDSGGLREAKCGTGYVIPVSTIERYRPVYDELAMPWPVVPENDPAPWVAAVRDLVSDRTLYQRESQAAREAAQQFVEGVDGAAMERFLSTLVPAERARSESATVESLSAEKRALLLELLRKRGARR